MGGLVLRDGAELPLGGEDLGGCGGQCGEGGLGGQAGRDDLAQVLLEGLERLVPADALRGERKGDALLVQDGGAGRLAITPRLAVLLDARRRGALGGYDQGRILVGKVEAEEDGHLLRDEPFDGEVRVFPAEHDRAQPELGGEVEGAVDLVAAVGLEDHGRLALEERGHRLEAGVGGRPLAGPARCSEGGD